MTKRGLLALGTLALLGILASGTSFGDVRRTTSPRRPYIVEVGEPYSISPSTLEREADHLTPLRDYIGSYGYPDYTEIQEIEPEWPWESYEVRAYYMRRNLELDFGHVFISPAMPHFGVIKFQSDIPPDKRHQIEVILQTREMPPAPPPAPPAVAAAPAPPAPPAAEVAQPETRAAEPPASGGLTEALVARIEAAAERAAQAADQAAEQSEAAVRAADRTTNLVNEMIETAATPPEPSHRRRR
jgi:hypothetical protein